MTYIVPVMAMVPNTAWSAMPLYAVSSRARAMEPPAMPSRRAYRLISAAGLVGRVMNTTRAMMNPPRKPIPMKADT